MRASFRGWSIAALTATVLLCGAPVALVAQPARSLAVLVLDPRDRPVALAELVLSAGSARQVLRTDSTGTARFAALPGDRWRLAVRRLGFHSVDVPVEPSGPDERITVLLEDAPASLGEVRVAADRAPASRLAAFEARLRTREANAVVTRAQIEKRNPIVLSQMLRGIAGIRVADSLGVTIAISTRGLKPTRAPNGQLHLVQCVLRMMIDGVVLPALTDIDDVAPREVHGVELFFGAARMPPELAGTRTDNWCGVIAIWTRAGDGDR
jgi:hypothetical protein